MLVLLTLLACATSTPPVSREVAAREVTFATLQSLGAFRLEWTLERAQRYGDEGPVTSQSVGRLLWGGPDRWELERRRGGAVQQRTVVVDGQGWQLTSGGRYEALRDVEPLRADVARSWDIWPEVVGAHEGGLVYTPAGVEEVAGRRADRFTLTLSPEAASRKSGPRLTLAEGEVWLDQETALRLQARLRIRVESRGQSVESTLLQAFADIGEEVTVTPPATQ